MSKFRLKGGITVDVGNLQGKWRFYPLSARQFSYPLVARFVRKDSPSQHGEGTTTYFQYISPDRGPYWPSVTQEYFLRYIWLNKA